MAKENSVPARMHKDFLKEIKDMQMKRILSGKDQVLKPTRTSRITLAMTRHKDWGSIKKAIIEADLKND